jgi:hypothetical protein
MSFKEKNFFRVSLDTNCDRQNVNQVAALSSGSVEYGLTESILQGVLINPLENPQLN